MQRFLPIEEIHGVIRGNISKDEVYQHFQKYEDEVLYVIDEKQMLKDIISPGDLYRYLVSERQDILNKNFIFLENISLKDAEMIFEKKRFLNEIPVVTEGKFLGVISNGKKKTQKEWERIRDSHTNNLTLREEISFYKVQCEQILSEYGKRGVDLYVLEYPSMQMLNMISEDLGRKLLYSCGMSGFLQMSERELKDYFKEDYYPGKEKRFADDYNKLSSYVINGRLILRDMDTEHFKIKDGHRNVENAPEKAKHKIILVGPCTAFGAYVQDNRTAGYYLQERLNSQFKDDYEVIISANLGGTNNFSALFCEELGCGDIVVFFASYNQLRKAFEKAAENLGCNLKKIDVREAFTCETDIVGNLFNSLFHHNHVIYRNIAECIFQQVDFNTLTDEAPERTAIQDYYIDYDVAEYYKKLKESISACFDIGKGSIGAIVMNCDPFTKGHRYLIERALEQIDYLYLFVVEEDKSVFLFKDRLEMVKQGVADLGDRVCVLPSGKYVISKDTFEQYFDKEKEIKEIQSTDYDVRIFGEVICKEFRICKRFAGEEPFDVVTKAYNDTMRRILPEYGVEFVEIPRKEVNGQVVSATTVRKCLENGELDKLDELIPDTTKKILFSHING